MNYPQNPPGTMKNQPGTLKKNIKNRHGFKNQIVTLNSQKKHHENHEQPTWNCENPLKRTWSWIGWLCVVHVVTGDAQEEVIIFRYRQTDTSS